MSTDRQDTPDTENDDQLPCPNDAAELLIQILEELNDINETAPNAVLNEHSISDNNGGA